MENTKINQIIEYLSLTLILSYFFVHNIFLVLFGIIFSLYLINIDRINKIKRSISKNLVKKEEYKGLNKNNREIESTNINIQSTKEDINLSLVEQIEEIGFIPSIYKKNDSNTA